MKLHMVIRGRNCEKYIDECIRSLYKQTDKNWTATIILDDPKDNSYKVALKYRDDKRIALHKHDTHFGLGFNIWYGCKFAVQFHGIGPDEPLGILDADDYLFSDAVERVLHYYKKSKNILCTYGTYIKKSKNRKTAVSNAYKSTDLPRRGKWHGSHFKTFRCKLFHYMPFEYLKDDKGNWLKAASDRALMVSILELAGLDRSKFISHPIYMWRDNTKHKTNVHEQKVCAKIVARKEPLQRIDV